jgi:hypothetical protein
MTFKPLTSAERKRGWVVLACPEHGEIVAVKKGTEAYCKCGRLARPVERKGRHPVGPGKEQDGDHQEGAGQDEGSALAG